MSLFFLIFRAPSRVPKRPRDTIRPRQMRLDGLLLRLRNNGEAARRENNRNSYLVKEEPRGVVHVFFFFFFVFHRREEKRKKEKSKCAPRLFPPACLLLLNARERENTKQLSTLSLQLFWNCENARVVALQRLTGKRKKKKQRERERESEK